MAGHIIECGTQATGGNFSGFRSLPHAGLPLGFPIAEISSDGSSVITKHDGTGGAVTVDTVTAQVVYEIQSTRYLNPDVTTLLDSIAVDQAGPDRVSISGVRGEAPPSKLKVCVNELGGFRNSVEFVLTGLEVEAKADWVHQQLTAALAANPPADVNWSRTSQPQPDAETEEARPASCTSTPATRSAPFTSAAVELALASYPGFTMTASSREAHALRHLSPGYVDRSVVSHTVVHADGTREVIADPEKTHDVEVEGGQRPSPYPAPSDVLTRRMPLGTFVHARSGDKGGDANLGLWIAHDGSPNYADRVTWLTKLITPKRIRELVPEAAELEIEVFMLPNLGGVNVLLRGLLGDGVASSTRFDPQAKGLGEWVRSRMVSVEEALL